MEKEHLHHDEFHGEISKKELKRAEELDIIYAEDDVGLDDDHYLDDNEFFKKYEYRTDYPKAPPMAEMFDESDNEPEHENKFIIN